MTPLRQRMLDALELRPGRHVAGVVDAAGEDGVVGVAAQEVDDDFHADARDEDGANLLLRQAV